LTVPESEVDLQFDAQEVRTVLEQLEALASGAKVMVDSACSEDKLSPVVGMEAARALVIELHELCEATVTAIDDFEQKHASNE
jgi:type II secretory pathway component GspD/PulD (secretin)